VRLHVSWEVFSRLSDVIIIFIVSSNHLKGNWLIMVWNLPNFWSTISYISHLEEPMLLNYNILIFKSNFRVSFMTTVKKYAKFMTAHYVASEICIRVLYLSTNVVFYNKALIYFVQRHQINYHYIVFYWIINGRNNNSYWKFLRASRRVGVQTQLRHLTWQFWYF
jgi:hypothetical protein